MKGYKLETHEEENTRVMVVKIYDISGKCPECPDERDLVWEVDRIVEGPENKGTFYELEEANEELKRRTVKEVLNKLANGAPYYLRGSENIFYDYHTLIDLNGFKTIGITATIRYTYTTPDKAVRDKDGWYVTGKDRDYYDIDGDFYCTVPVWGYEARVFRLGDLRNQARPEPVWRGEMEGRTMTEAARELYRRARMEAYITSRYRINKERTDARDADAVEQIREDCDDSGDVWTAEITDARGRGYELRIFRSDKPVKTVLVRHDRTTSEEKEMLEKRKNEIRGRNNGIRSAITSGLAKWAKDISGNYLKASPLPEWMEWYKGPGEERPIVLTDNLIIPPDDNGPDGGGPDDDGPDGGQPEPEAEADNSNSPEGPGEEPDIDAGSVYEARAELGARTGMPAWYDAIA